MNQDNYENNNHEVDNSRPQLTKKERRTMKREEREKDLAKQKSAQSYKKFFILGITLLIVGVGIFWFLKYLTSPVSIEENKENILATCVNHSNASVMHIHPILSIVINGVEHEVPKNIGISAYCMQPIHTHDSTGTLHVEFTRPYDFTLQDFFAIWEETFSSSQILDSVVDEAHEIVVTVNGERVLNYDKLVLEDNARIEIIFQEKQVTDASTQTPESIEGSEQ